MNKSTFLCPLCNKVVEAVYPQLEWGRCDNNKIIRVACGQRHITRIIYNKYRESVVLPEKEKGCYPNLTAMFAVDEPYSCVAQISGKKYGGKLYKHNNYFVAGHSPILERDCIKFTQEDIFTSYIIPPTINEYNDITDEILMIILRGA